MIRPRFWKALAAAAVVGGLSLGFSTSLLLAKPGKVVLKGGQSYEGEVKESKEQGTVEILTAKGERVKVSAANVNRIEYDPDAPPDNTPAPPDGNTPVPPPAPEPGSVEADLRNRLAALPRNDVRLRVALARTALQRREYGVARDALDQALQLDPRNQEAADLLKTVDAQQRLDQRGPGGNPRMPPGERPPGDRGPGAGAPPGDLLPPLTPDDINRIRQREWTRNDKLVKVRLVGDVKRRYVASARDIRPADFNNLPAIEQAWQIVSKGDDSMQNDVRLTTDPLALHEYRTIVQRAILPTCAAAACHGGGPGGRFQLYPRADHEGEAYANFLTLSTYTYSPKPPPGPAGVPAAAPAGGPAEAAPGGPAGAAPGAAASGAQGAAGAPSGAAAVVPAAPGGAAPSGILGGRARRFQMIDRDRPADSLLIQFALPRNLSDSPHPDVPQFRPVFRMLKDPKHDQFLRWISNDLSPLQRDYGIKIAQNQAPDVTGARPGPAGQVQPGQPQPGQQQPGQGQPAPGQQPPSGQGAGQNRAAPPPAPPQPRGGQ